MMVDRLGQQLGDYRLTRMLAHGELAEVYLGEHLLYKDSSPVAIKILHNSLSVAEQESFLSEALLLANLTHPQIVRLISYGVDNNHPYLILQYVSHGTLRQRYPMGASAPLPLVISYVHQMASALHYAHERNVIHGDIRPENILQDKDDQILLSDFGIPTLLRYRDIRKSDALHALSYMAPELIDGQPSRATDQYALGALIYEWLSGTPPFMGRSFEEIAAKQRAEKPLSLLHIIPSLPPEIADVIMVGLAKDPNRRFRNVQAFAKAFENACRNHVSPAAFAAPTPTGGPGRITGPGPQLRETDEEEHIPTLISLSDPNHDGKTVILPSGGNPPSGPAHQGTNPPERHTTNPPRVSLPDMTATVPEGEMLHNPYEQPDNPFETPALQFPVPSGQGTGPYGSTNRDASGPYPPASYSETTTRQESSPTYPPLAETMAAYPISPTPAPSTPTPAPPTPTPSGTQYPQVPTPSTAPTPVTERDGSDREKTRRHFIIGGVVAILACTGVSAAALAFWPRNEADPKPKEPTGPKTQYVFDKHKEPVYTVMWSPDGRYLASGGLDKQALVWDPKNGEVRSTYKQHTESVNALAWGPIDGTQIITASADKTLHLWDVVNAKESAIWKEHTNNVREVAWSPDEQFVASCDDDGKIHVWSASTRELKTTYTGHTGRVWALTWSSDGKQVASVGVDGTAQVWEALTGKKGVTYTSNRPLKTIMWQPEGTLIASGGDERTVQIWDATTGKLINTCSGHSNSINSLCWSPNGKFIASGGNEGVVYIWNAETGKEQAKYTKHTLAIQGVSWSPSGKSIASASDDKSVHVWDIEL